MTQVSTKRSWLWWVWYVGVGAATLTLAAAVLLRIFYHDGTPFLIWINSFTRYVYLPAYACLIWASWMRRRWLAAAAFAVVACHLMWVLPDFVRDRRFDKSDNEASTAIDSPTVRIFFSNVLGSRDDFTRLWQETADANPDVVVMAEASHYSVQSFLRFPSFAEFSAPNGSGRSRRGEVVVFSKLPIKSETQTYIADRVVQTIDVEVGSQTLRIIGLHSPRPMPPPAHSFFHYYSKVIPLLTSEDVPRVIVGDFNVTQYSLVYKKLKAGGLRSAHEDRGRGYATTWPNGLWPLPPIRIDQAFLSADVECLGIREGRGDGSDHKPLIVDVQMRSLRP